MDLVHNKKQEVFLMKTMPITCKQVSIHEAKTHLSRLINDLVDTKEILITKSGTPVAKIVPVEDACSFRPLGNVDHGKIVIHDTFWDPLPNDFID